VRAGILWHLDFPLWDPPRGAFRRVFPTARLFLKDRTMATVETINASLGTARDAVYDRMEALLNDKTTDPGAKSAALLQAQADLGITDGIQNVLAKGYNRWAQTGQ
jgi:hypothetical protein